MSETATIAEMYADFERTGTLAPMYARALFSRLERLEAENEQLREAFAGLAPEGLDVAVRDGMLQLGLDLARLRLIEEAARAFEDPVPSDLVGMVEWLLPRVEALRSALTKKEEG